MSCLYSCSPSFYYCRISLASTLLCVRTAGDANCYLYQLRNAKRSPVQRKFVCFLQSWKPTTVPCPQQHTYLQTYLLLTILILAPAFHSFCLHKVLQSFLSMCVIYTTHIVSFSYPAILAWIRQRTQIITVLVTQCSPSTYSSLSYFWIFFLPVHSLSPSVFFRSCDIVCSLLHTGPRFDLASYPVTTEE